MMDDNEIGMVGAIYDVNSGRVEFKDYSPLLNHFGKKKTNELPEMLSELVDSESVDVAPKKKD